MKYFLFYFALLIGLNGNAQHLNDKYLKYLSVYCDIPFDSAMHHIFVSDSFKIHKSALKIYHFYDSRDTYLIYNHDSTETRRLIKRNGFLVANEITGNTYVYFKKDNIEMVKDSAILSKKAYYGIPIFYYPPPNEFYTRQALKDSFALFSLNNEGLSMKLSSILNDLPQSIKMTMNRVDLDSIFRCILFFADPENTDRIGGQLWDSNSVDLNTFICTDKRMLYKNIVLEKIPFSVRNQAYKFYDFLERNSYKTNCFLYSGGSNFINIFGDFCLISVNEGIKEKSINMAYHGKNAYQYYDSEPNLFNIKIYCFYNYYK
jgi:hypothetical protein